MSNPMGGPEADLPGIFRDKPERVIGFPEELLSQEAIAAFRKMENPAVVEMAGRDSVAAAIQAVTENGFTDLLPVYAYTGSEYGPWENVPRAVDRLRRRLPDARVHPLLVMGSPAFWRAVNGRFVSELIAAFGFYTPCVGCHLYLHAVRIPLARQLGSIPIIAGERESHGGKIKVNQTAAALDFYRRFCADFGIRLEMPLRHVANGEQIEAILGMPWKQGGEQLGCCLSGNYRRISDLVDVDEARVSDFLERFAGPCTKRIIAAYTGGQIPDHLAIAEEVLASCI